MVTSADPDRGGTAARRHVARLMANAAGAWLDTLNADQRRIAVGAVPAYDESDAERRAGSTRRPTTAG